MHALGEVLRVGRKGELENTCLLRLFVFVSGWRGRAVSLDEQSIPECSVRSLSPGPSRQKETHEKSPQNTVKSSAFGVPWFRRGHHFASRRAHERSCRIHARSRRFTHLPHPPAPVSAAITDLAILASPVSLVQHMMRARHRQQ